MKRATLFIGSLISLIFIIIVLENIDFQQVWLIIQSIHWYILIPAIIIQLASYWVRSIRWKVMIENIKIISAGKLFPIICISYMANNTLPLRIGEIVRAYSLGEKEKISIMTSFSSVLLERIFDGLTLLLFLFVTSLLYPFPAWVKQIGILSFIFFFVAFTFVVILVRKKQHTVQIIAFLNKIFSKKIVEKIYKITNQFIDGFEIINNVKSFLIIFLYSILIWIMEAFLFYAMSVAFNIPNPLVASFFSLVVVNLGVMIPSSPGYIGTFEYFVSKSLEVFRVTKEVAFGFSLVMRIAQYLPITLLGFLFLLKEGISIKQLMRLNKSNLRQTG